MAIPLTAYWQLLVRYLRPQRGFVGLLAGLLFGGLMLWRGNLLAPFTGHFVVNAINLRSLSRRLGESARLAAPDGEES